MENLVLWVDRFTVPEFSWEELSHNEERNISETARVGDNEEEQTGEWKPSKCFLYIGTINFKHVKESSESCQSDGHENTRYEKK